MKKKEYKQPYFEKLSVTLTRNVLLESDPGGGSWGYFDDDPTLPTNPTEFDDFEW